MRIIIDIIVIILPCRSCLIMILPSEKSATDVAAQCFLNALIRETKDWQLAEYPPDELIIPLDEQKSLHFRVAYFSPTQHHRFAFPAHLVTASGSYPVDFTTLSRLIIDKLRHQLFLPVPSAKLSTNACWKATPIRNRQLMPAMTGPSCVKKR